MKDLAYRPNVPVGSLPTPTTALAGVVVRLTTDNKPYWCNGTQWVDLTAAGGGGTTTNALTIGTGLSGSPVSASTFDGSAAVTVSVAFGTTASTACVGNDSRLSDARTPTSHTHGNITNAGAIGSTSGLPIITTTGGVLTTGSFGTTAGTFCQGNDGRLSDTRNTTNALTIDFDSGTTEGTDQYTFNGSSAKSLNIVAGTNVTLTKAAGQITINASGGGGGTPGGSTSSIQWNLSGTFQGAANARIEDDDLLLGYDGADASTPLTADTVKVYAKRFGATGGRTMVAAKGPSGMDYTLQPAIFRQKVAWWNPPGNATTVPGVMGLAAPTAVGTATARTVATTNALTRTKRLGYVSSTTAGNLGGHYVTAAQYSVSSVGNLMGGLFYSCRFGVSDAKLQTVARTFVGISSSVSAPTNVDPATLTNCIGIGHTASDTNWFLYYGGSAAQTRISLGANFPINNTDLLDITIWAPPASATVYVEVTRINSTQQFVSQHQLGPGTAGTTLPATTTLLAHRAWRTNNTAAAAVGIDISNIYIETDW